MKTLFHYVETAPDGTAHGRTLEADDQIVIAIAEALSIASKYATLRVETDARLAASRTDLIRGLGGVLTTLAKAYGDGFQSGVLGKEQPTPTTQRTMEAEVIETFMRGLAASSTVKIFGEWTSGKCDAPGILTESQVRILVEVMDGASTSMLDALVMDGAVNALTADQRSRKRSATTTTRSSRSWCFYGNEGSRSIASRKRLPKRLPKRRNVQPTSPIRQPASSRMSGSSTRHRAEKSFPQGRRRPSSSAP